MREMECTCESSQGTDCIIFSLSLSVIMSRLRPRALRFFTARSMSSMSMGCGVAMMNAKNVQGQKVRAHQILRGMQQSAQRKSSHIPVPLAHGEHAVLVELRMRCRGHLTLLVAPCTLESFGYRARSRSLPYPARPRVPCWKQGGRLQWLCTCC